jgi:hypothetical protein
VATWAAAIPPPTVATCRAYDSLNDAQFVFATNGAANYRPYTNSTFTVLQPIVLAMLANQQPNLTQAHSILEYFRRVGLLAQPPGGVPNKDLQALIATLVANNL